MDKYNIKKVFFGDKQQENDIDPFLSGDKLVNDEEQSLSLSNEEEGEGLFSDNGEELSDGGSSNGKEEEEEGEEEEGGMSGGAGKPKHKKKVKKPKVLSDSDDETHSIADTVDLLSNDPLFLVLSHFFVSKETGDNIATILDKINKNLEKVGRS